MKTGLKSNMVTYILVHVCKYVIDLRATAQVHTEENLYQGATPPISTVIQQSQSVSKREHVFKDK